MNLPAAQKLIGSINVKQLLVIIAFLSFFLVFGQNTELMENETKVLTTDDKASNSTNVIKQNHTPRVVVVVVQTHATEGWCRLMLSAIMNKIEIVTIALGALYSHEKRPGWIMEYIDNEMLKDEDIIISVDGSDTIVTERKNFEKSVQYFINKSAPNESSFTSYDIIKGIQISPMIFLADPHCFAPQLDIIIDSAHKEHVSRCHWFYKYAHNFVEKYSLAKIMKNAENGHDFLSAGAFVARVWAFRKARAAYNSVLETSNKWWCDQSIWVLVFIWSVTQTNLGSNLRALPSGVIALDYDSKFFHYPLYDTTPGASILHFTGDPISWKKKTPTIISRLSWYNNLSQRIKQGDFLQNKVLDTELEFYVFNKAKKGVSFGTICTKQFLNDSEKIFEARK